MWLTDLLALFRGQGQTRPYEPQPASPAPLPARALVTLALMHAAAPYTPSARLLVFVDWINRACVEFDITTPGRVAQFLAQVAHESDGFKATAEYASGAAYDTGSLAARLGNTPEADGDGQRWKGHGLIMVTGLANHRAAAVYFGIPLERVADWLQTPEGACRSAGRYWTQHGCNELADAGDFDATTRAINGGYNGAADRRQRLAAIQAEQQSEGVGV